MLDKHFSNTNLCIKNTFIDTNDDNLSLQYKLKRNKSVNDINNIDINTITRIIIPELKFNKLINNIYHEIIENNLYEELKIPINKFINDLIIKINNLKKDNLKKKLLIKNMIKHVNKTIEIFNINIKKKIIIYIKNMFLFYNNINNIILNLKDRLILSYQDYTVSYNINIPYIIHIYDLD